MNQDIVLLLTAVAIGAAVGVGFYIFIKYLLGGTFTVNENERVVLVSFGRASRIRAPLISETKLGEAISDGEKDFFDFPQLKVYGPGGPYFKFPWQTIERVNVSIQTVNIAFDPEQGARSSPDDTSELEAVTKDQLEIGIAGQLRYKISDQNLYAYMFGVKDPIVHVIGFFTSILRERIANFYVDSGPVAVAMAGEPHGLVEQVSINALRRNLNRLNDQMDEESRGSVARYGVALDASLITGITSSAEIEAALAAVNTVSNEVEARLSEAKATAAQKLEEAKGLVAVNRMKAETEIEPLKSLAVELQALSKAGPHAVDAYVKHQRLGLYSKASHIYLEDES